MPPRSPDLDGADASVRPKCGIDGAGMSVAEAWQDHNEGFSAWSPPTSRCAATTTSHTPTPVRIGLPRLPPRARAKD